jgi:hypothetical protein
VADPKSFVTAAPPGNADVDWDAFDSVDYFEHNYGDLHREDAEIIGLVADFFQRAAPGRWRTRAIDVGSGANLYPAMTMLPFTSEIVLYERAHPNRQWLSEQLRRPAPSWTDFWQAVSGRRPEYCRIAQPLDVLSRTANVVKGDLFSLEPDQYDIGTMFFVAESITNRHDEFRRAIRLFVDALAPRAPFAMTFMRESSGYLVGGRAFPACSVNENDVRRCLDEVTQNGEVHVVDSHDLREGYDGMIVAYGHKK